MTLSSRSLTFDAAWWFRTPLLTALFSLAVYILGWPDTRLGIAVNSVILALVVVGGTELVP